MKPGVACKWCMEPVNASGDCPNRCQARSDAAAHSQRITDDEVIEAILHSLPIRQYDVLRRRLQALTAERDDWKRQALIEDNADAEVIERLTAERDAAHEEGTAWMDQCIEADRQVERLTAERDAALRTVELREETIEEWAEAQRKTAARAETAEARNAAARRLIAEWWAEWYEDRGAPGGELAERVDAALRGPE